MINIIYLKNMGLSCSTLDKDIFETELELRLEKNDSKRDLWTGTSKCNLDGTPKIERLRSKTI